MRLEHNSKQLEEESQAQKEKVPRVAGVPIAPGADPVIKVGGRGGCCLYTEIKLG